MDDGERLRLEYDQATQQLRSLAETRFRLLALVPSLSGAVVALVSAGRSGIELLAIGGLGLSATLGVLVYELRNGERTGHTARRVRDLEARLLPDGPLVAPARGRLFGIVGLSQSLGVALVYGAALGGWSYLVAWGALSAAGMHAHARSTGLAIGAVAGLLVLAEVLRLELPLERDEAVAPSSASPS